MDKDYWDTDDLKFDFWYRLQRHQQIFYEVMKLNGKNFNNNNYKDHTQELLDKLIEQNKDYNVEIIWED
jgi:spermidine/putrescine-binding protein